MLEVGDIVLVQFNPPGTISGEGDTWNAKFIRAYAVVGRVDPSRFSTNYAFYIPPCTGPCGDYGGLEEADLLPEETIYLHLIAGPFDATMRLYQDMTLEERAFIKAARKKLGLMEQIDRMFWKGDDKVYRSSDGYSTDGIGCPVHAPGDTERKG